MIKIWPFISLVFFLESSSLATNDSQVFPLSGDDVTAPINNLSRRRVPGDKVVPPVDGQSIEDAVARARRAWLEQQSRLDLSTKEPEANEKPILPEPGPPRPTIEQTPLKKAQVSVRVTQAEDPKPLVLARPNGPTVTVFRQHVMPEPETITLPAGSHAFGRVKFGEEVSAQGEQEVLVEFDYAFLGPNQSVVELTGCVAWLNVRANFNTQRVKGSMQDLTCTMPSGRVFTLPFHGPLVDLNTGYAGVDSDLIMRGPARAAAFKFLSEITRAYGEAAAAVETTNRIVSAGEGQTDKVSNITGDKSQYMGGKVIEANGKFLDYIAGFFTQMQPTLALAPGAKVHVVNRYNLKIPKEFFKTMEARP